MLYIFLLKSKNKINYEIHAREKKIPDVTGDPTEHNPKIIHYQDSHLFIFRRDVRLGINNIMASSADPTGHDRRLFIFI